MEDLFRYLWMFLSRRFFRPVVEPPVAVIAPAPWLDSGAGKMRNLYDRPGGGNAHQRRVYRRKIERITQRVRSQN